MHSESWCCLTVLDGALQLIDGPSTNEGRLMISYKDHFGAVCSDRFGEEEANTACFQLGFAGHQQVVQCCPYGRRYYGEIWLDELACGTRDVWLGNCTHRGWGVEDCHNGQEVGVKCNSKLSLRLSGGCGLFEGRVEQFYAGSWGTVCDTDWDMNDAKVVCRQLGMGEPVEAVRGGRFGVGKGPIMLSNLQCNGSETALAWCLHPGWKTSTCPHSQDAGVVCKGPVMESIRVQSTSYSITLHFTLPPQLQYIGTLRGFRVVIHEVNSKLKYTSTTVLLPSSSPTKPKLTIDRLRPDARHSFNISLVLNGGATGNLAPLVYGTTLEAAPGLVHTFSGYPINSTSVALYWTPPLITNGRVIWYHLTYTSGSEYISPPTTRHIVGGLARGVGYQFMLAAVTRGGRGPPTSLPITTPYF